MFRLTAILVAIVLNHATLARGESIVAYEFTGRVTAVDDYNGASTFHGSIPLNAPVTGQFVVDQGQTGVIVPPWTYYDAALVFSVDIGAGLFTWEWSSGPSDYFTPGVEIIDNEDESQRDLFYFYCGETSPTNLVVPPGTTLPVPLAILGSVMLEDLDETVFSDSGFPTTLDLADFESAKVYVHIGYPAGEDVVGVFATITVTLDSLTPVFANTPPTAAGSIVINGEDAGQSAEVECDGPSGATVLLDGSASSDPDGDDLEYEWSVAEDSGASIAHPGQAMTEATFPVGVHQVTLTVYDVDENGQPKGGMDVASLSIMVVDGMPPLVRVTTDLAALFPSNKLVPVAILVEASDACSNPADIIVRCTVASSQPDDSDGTGEHTGDVNGKDGFLNAVPVALEYAGDGLYGALVYLRAERDGDDKAGRIYSVNVEVLDPAGNSGQASTAVVVPHDRRRN